MDTDPWDGYPDTPWIVDGYLLDDAVSDLIMQSRKTRNGEPRYTAQDVLEILQDQIRSRMWDQKDSE